MAEYIIYWSGIGAELIELSKTTPPWLWPKKIRKKRLKERIVRCRDCRFMNEVLKSSWQVGSYKVTECGLWADPKWGAMVVVRDGFCAWGERREK